jgi:hypothetical protein
MGTGCGASEANACALGLFEPADLAASGRDLTGGIPVSLDHAGRAAALYEYFESHARRIYGCISSPEYRAAQGLGRRIQDARLPETLINDERRVRGAEVFFQCKRNQRRLLQPGSLASLLGLIVKARESIHVPDIFIPQLNPRYSARTGVKRSAPLQLKESRDRPRLRICLRVVKSKEDLQSILVHALPALRLCINSLIG